MASSTRLRAPSLLMRLARCDFTVLRLMQRSSAISALVRPRATVTNTSSSRSVSGSSGWAAGSRADAPRSENDDNSRAVTLGARAYGTARHVAKTSKLPEYPQETARDLEHVKLLAERIEKYLEAARTTRGTGEKVVDTDSVDLVTGIITEFEKHAWFLRASLEG